jgi:hypothetical protein
MLDNCCLHCWALPLLIYNRCFDRQFVYWWLSPTQAIWWCTRFPFNCHSLFGHFVIPQYRISCFPLFGSHVEDNICLASLTTINWIKWWQSSSLMPSLRLRCWPCVGFLKSPLYVENVAYGHHGYYNKNRKKKCVHDFKLASLLGTIVSHEIEYGPVTQL